MIRKDYAPYFEQKEAWHKQLEFINKKLPMWGFWTLLAVIAMMWGFK